MAHASLWGLVLLGAVGGVVASLRAAHPTAVAAAAEDEEAPAGACGAGELVVRDWLRTGAVAGDATPSLREEPGLTVVGTAVVDQRAVGHDYWAVVVAADIVSGDETSRWFVEVGVARVGDGYAVASAPAVVAGRHESTAVRPAGPSLRVPPPGDEAVATVEAFLGALLAGTGDVSRYLAPGVDGRAVVPAPFASVRVERTALVDRSEGQAVIRVEAVAETASEAELTLGYEVRLAQRGGRWEVESFTGAPTLAAASVPAEPTSTTPLTVPPTATSTSATTVPLEPGA